VVVVQGEQIGKFGTIVENSPGRNQYLTQGKKRTSVRNVVVRVLLDGETSPQRFGVGMLSEVER
jgi:hypothetical protein